MRRVAGIGLLTLGFLLLVAGAVVAVAMGPDNQLETGPHEVRTDGRAVVTRPAVLARYGPQVSVLVEVPDDKPVFLGLGHTVDVENYVASTERLEVTRYRPPWSLRTQTANGEPQLPAAPTALDWWLSQSAGLGGAQLRFTLPDDVVSLAVLAVGDSDLEGLKVTAAYEVPGSFGVGVGMAATGLGTLLFGLVALRLVPGVRRRTPLVDALDLADDEWDVPWPETDPSDADTWDDFLSEEAAPGTTTTGAPRSPAPPKKGLRKPRWPRRARPQPIRPAPSRPGGPQTGAEKPKVAR
ncbi:hypothetical protein [Mumia zhuanghuii]|uniref:Uncharacterized protein n=1 Tax=Mumia zhuanghuii TaxID=2585211 RepID=A0A5C4MDU5_9ACTN|nr:hypothetical protein [Mumia zhuanghuii]TNC33694.1 hypothetical protein FHE65_28520 [Mumia zhuanghuii]TNC33928.1 hypothetical protein FHE65_28320 [Mumia zhuanghuii]